MNPKKIFITALWTFLLYLAGIIPFIGQAVAMLAPVPLIISYVRNGRLSGVAALGIACAIVFGLGGWQSAVLLVLFGLMAIGAGEGMLRRMRHESVVIFGGILPLAAGIIILVIYYGIGGVDPLSGAETYMRESISYVVRIYTELGFTEAAERVSSISDRLVFYLTRLIPAFVVSTVLVQVSCCYGLARIIILRREAGDAGLVRGRFSEWHAPDKWVWGLIAALGFVIIQPHPMKIASWNLLLVFGLVYTVQGMAVIEYYLSRASLPAFVRVLIFAVLLALPAAVLIPVLGLLDVWADFRKTRQPLSPSA